MTIEAMSLRALKPKNIDKKYILNFLLLLFLTTKILHVPVCNHIYKWVKGTRIYWWYIVWGSRKSKLLSLRWGANNLLCGCGYCPFLDWAPILKLRSIHNLFKVLVLWNLCSILLNNYHVLRLYVHLYSMFCTEERIQIRREKMSF